MKKKEGEHGLRFSKPKGPNGGPFLHLFDTRRDPGYSKSSSFDTTGLWYLVSSTLYGKGLY